jgi:hypothetical protein
VKILSRWQKGGTVKIMKGKGPKKGKDRKEEKEKGEPGMDDNGKPIGDKQRRIEGLETKRKTGHVPRIFKNIKKYQEKIQNNNIDANNNNRYQTSGCSEANLSCSSMSLSLSFWFQMSISNFHLLSPRFSTNLGANLHGGRTQKRELVSMTLAGGREKGHDGNGGR